MAKRTNDLGNDPVPQLLLRLVLLTLCYAAAVTDLRRQRVDNRLVAALGIAWVLILAPLVLVDPEGALTMGGTGLAGFLLAGAVLLLVYFVSRKGLGGGDVKLMTVAGLYLGYDGALSALLYGSVLAALSALVLILGKKMTAKDTIPLVPFLYVGILLTEFVR